MKKTKLTLSADPELVRHLHALSARTGKSVSAILEEWATRESKYTSPEALATIVTSFHVRGPNENSGVVWFEAEPDEFGIRRLGDYKDQRELCIDHLTEHTHLTRAEATVIADQVDWDHRPDAPRPPTAEELAAQRHWGSAVTDAMIALQNGVDEETITRELLMPGKFRPGYNSIAGEKIVLQARYNLAISKLNDAGK